MSGREKIWYMDDDRGLIVKWVPVLDGPDEEPREEPDDLWPELMLCLECLTEKQRFVIECRYGLRGDPIEQEEVASLMGTTQQAVAKIEAAAIEKMRRVVRKV